MTTEEKVQNYWQKFQKEKNITTENYEAWAFGAGKKMADELAALTVKGLKTATTSALELYEPAETKPKVGEYNVILDGSQKPVCITQTVVVEVLPFDQVSAEHAYHEGEGDRTLAYWRRVHQDFFSREYAESGRDFSEKIPCLCEVFKLVYR